MGSNESPQAPRLRMDRIPRGATAYGGGLSRGGPWPLGGAVPDVGISAGLVTERPFRDEFAASRPQRHSAMDFLTAWLLPTLLEEAARPLVHSVTRQGLAAVMPDRSPAHAPPTHAPPRGFAFLKDPLFLASPEFVKKPERIVALVMALSLSVYRLAEHRLREWLATTGQTVPNQVKQPTDRPCAACFRVLRGSTWSDSSRPLARHTRILSVWSRCMCRSSRCWDPTARTSTKLRPEVAHCGRLCS
jgi:hypothetical protein